MSKANVWDQIITEKENREKIKLVVNAAKARAHGLVYNVTYRWAGNDGKFPKAFKSYACFANFFNERKPNYKYYCYKPNTNTLSEKQATSWIRTGYAVGILPHNKDDNKIDSKQTWKEISQDGWIVDIRNPELTEAKLYVALSFIRFMSDETEVVKLCLNLMDLGISFWQAFIFAHGRCMFHPGHSFLNISLYASHGSIGNAKDLALVRKFRAFCRNSIDLGSPKIVENKEQYKSWKVAPLMTNKKDSMVMVAPEAILSPLVVPLVTAPNFKKARNKLLGMAPEIQALFDKDSLAKLTAAKVADDAEAEIQKKEVSNGSV